MSIRIKASAAILGVTVAAGTAGWAVADRFQGQAAPPEINPRSPYTVVIPKASYQALVISPKSSGSPRAEDPGSTLVPFVIRTRDAEDRVSDFPFFVRVGDLHTMTFPSGWTPPTEAALFAPREASFAAWGVTAGAGGGQIIRFEPITRDPDRDTRDRDRARDFDEFLREVKRNR